MSTGREMVKLGEMMLRGGRYRGNCVMGKTALSWLWTNLVEITFWIIAGDIRDVQLLMVRGCRLQPIKQRLKIGRASCRERV